jgi:acetyl-CoA C-acetyltransferase
MGEAGELCAEKYAISREAQDAFATESYNRARAAQKAGAFTAEIAPVAVPQRNKDPLLVAEDEEPGRGRLEGFASLRPAFKKDGTITAANASSINDGAAALVLASQVAIEQHGLTPLARIVGSAATANAPEWFTTAPAGASQRVLERLGLGVDDIDLWEINEAFSCVTLACSKLVGIDESRVNVRGGAVALGHPIGATGARLVTTLLHALAAEQKQRGLATLCIGGGEAIALVIERL